MTAEKRTRDPTRLITGILIGCMGVAAIFSGIFGDDMGTAGMLLGVAAVLAVSDLRREVRDLRREVSRLEAALQSSTINKE